MIDRAAVLIATLGLSPHPEGGYWSVSHWHRVLAIRSVIRARYTALAELL